MTQWLKEIIKLDSVNKMHRFLYANGIRYFDLVSSDRFFWLISCDYYIKNYTKDYIDYFQSANGYNEVFWLEYLNNCEDVDPYIQYIFMSLDNLEKRRKLPIFIIADIYSKGKARYSIESLSSHGKNSTDKYGLTELIYPLEANSKGLKHKENFFFYHSLFNVINGVLEPIPQIKQINLLDKNKLNKVSLRLFDELSIPYEYYNQYEPLFFQKYFEPDYNLSEIYVPDQDALSVHIDPKTKNKLYVRVSKHEYENWIEIEEIPVPSSQSELIKTRYIHSIFDTTKKVCTHIDGSYNFYNSELYQEVYYQTKLQFASKHIKMWLVEGELSTNEWGKLVLSHIKEHTLLHEIFKGREADEIFKNHFDSV